MYLRRFLQSVLGLVLLVSSSFALSNTEFTYNNNGESIEILGCENICPLNLVIPNEINGLPVTKIGWAAFSNNHLTSVFIPNSVITIANLAFDNNNLSTVVIPESVETIGWLAFSNNNLQAVSLPAGIERLEDGAFYSNELTDILIPNNVTFIGVNSFKGNEINNITLSNNLSLISSDAFADNNINNLTIPSSVLSIDERAFFQNPLDNVTFLGDRPYIGKDAFSIVQEKDESFWQTTTFDNCWNYYGPEGITEEYMANNPDDYCDSTYYDYISNPSDTLLFFCENSNGWPGSSIFINEYREDGFYDLSTCDDSIPGHCDEFWLKEVSSPLSISSCPINNNSFEIIISNYSMWDIDQSGSVDALSDGLILLRYFFGLRGDSLISGVISPNANRTSAADIEAYIESHMP